MSIFTQTSMRKMERTEEGNVISEEKESVWVGKQHILEEE